MNNAFGRFFKTGATEDPNPNDVEVIRNGENDKRIEGKIIRISEQGWGFLSSRAIPFTRIFFHWTSLQQDTLNFADLKRGMNVEFTAVELEGKGWRALKIRVILPEETATTTE